MKRNRFLDLVCAKLRKDRPKVPDSLNSTVWIERRQSRTFVQLWFRTRGCRHNHRGGCTMCDYWISDSVTPDQMSAFVGEALEKLDFEPDILLLNSSGSFFDDWEVPPKAREEIFRLISKFCNTVFIFETRADTVSEKTIVECTSILDSRKVNIEIGLESANPWILKYCVNKALETQEFMTSIQVLKRCDVGSTANILIGIPFLTVSEMVGDAVFSVNWAFNQGVERCVLFPMNTKPWTLIYWLEKFGLYTRPSLWALVEVMARLDTTLLPHTEISWYKTRPQLHPKYSIPNQGPITCPECYDAVIALLDRYIFSHSRSKIVEQLVARQCRCKDVWRNQLKEKPTLTVRERVQDAYQVIGKQILGEQWWSQYGETVLANVAAPD